MAIEKAAVPANVVEITGKTLEQARGDIPNAIMLLDSNTVDVRYTPAFNKLPADLQHVILVAQTGNPVISLERPLDATGKVDATNPNMVIAAAVQKDGQPLGIYHPALMGRLRQIPNGYLLYTHYHTSSKADFSYPAFEKALAEYCMLAFALGTKEQPVVINMPGLQCANSFVWEEINGERVPVLSPRHLERVKEVIANTMFAGSTVYLVL
ncbi:hypothetical protein SIMMY50_126 [Erwinia phage vB_EamM_Simmy50]|uniref:Uncharacterized protein n=1 Tax=Erwinia phage vB_EamM_Simmy50 TaxID=1815988 RepID=A0A173GDM1_9CAUD|nr:hypothetical protein FDH99_gp126 [Erwinia phage vB_EamM_Simmy50]ANH51588.1 hypothetical protein SIMMY50_126 [Erwinia phage vB_EamM_Simmy50]